MEDVVCEHGDIAGKREVFKPIDIDKLAEFMEIKIISNMNRSTTFKEDFLRAISEYMDSIDAQNKE